MYRTYVSHRGIGEEDRRIVNWAVGVARKRSTGAEVSVFDFLRDVLLGDAAVERPDSHSHAMLEFAMKFQQVTSPVTAKGVEDTAFYRFNRLVCLNEVGADPRRFSVSTSAFHQANLERARSWPHAMLATSTHDTKRSEDVRARIAVLSELPELWKLHLPRWSRLNRGKRRQLDDGPAPDREDEYLIYQTLIGLWPVDADVGQLIERLQAYAVKAAREAKRSTSWLDPNADYEKALGEFVAALLENAERNAFLRDFGALAGIVAYFGRLNSLVQTVLKLTSPGVPDFYQGTELPSLAVVDPDNRRPVDFDAADERLQSLEKPGRSPGSMLSVDDPAAKLFVTWTLLQLRRRDPDLFASGAYQALQCEGEQKDHVLAFARAHEGRSCIVIVPRWNAKLMNGVTELPLGASVWGDTSVQLGETGESTLREMFTGAQPSVEAVGGERLVRMANLFADVPLAVLYTGTPEKRRACGCKSGLHSAHPCASPFGQRSCAKR
ncbi:MAG: malto-oligosyltrehalose synthase, partial [Burkholderiaceae bacterium]